jgi:hypothetical protein
MAPAPAVGRLPPGRAPAILRSAALPDGRELTFALDPGALDDPLVALVLGRGYTADASCELVLDLLAHGGTFVDVGAGTGIFTLAAAALGCRVLALEASSARARLLRTALAYNGFANVTVVPGVAASEPGFVEEETRAYRLDDLMLELGIEHADLIRIAEAADGLETLRGLDRSLAADDVPTLLFGSSRAEVEHTLTERGYSLFAVAPGTQGTLAPLGTVSADAGRAGAYLALKGPQATASVAVPGRGARSR